MRIADPTATALAARLRDVDEAHSKAQALLRAPKGKSPEQLEDALNELQDAAYNARRAYRAHDVT